MLLYHGLYDFYNDYDEYCIYVSSSENYHFVIEGKQPCKIKWDIFLGLQSYYLFIFLAANFFVSLPAIVIIKKIKKSISSSEE